MGKFRFAPFHQGGLFAKLNRNAHVLGPLHAANVNFFDEHQAFFDNETLLYDGDYCYLALVTNGRGLLDNMIERDPHDFHVVPGKRCRDEVFFDTGFGTNRHAAGQHGPFVHLRGFFHDRDCV